MLLNVAIAAFMMAVTTGIHSVGMMLALRAVEAGAKHSSHWLRGRHIYQFAGIVLLMFFASLVEVSLWAGTYLVLGASKGLEKTLYFSMTAFTTLGYGDILLDERWRLLSSFEAVNGIIMFGWTTAIVVAAVRHIHFGEVSERHNYGEASNNQ